MPHVHDSVKIEGLLTQQALCQTPQSTATSANGTLALVVGSSMTQYITGAATGFNVNLPVATTLAQGWVYDIWNFSTQPIDIQAQDGSLLATLRANGRTLAYLRDATSANGVWALTYTLDNGNVFGTSQQIDTDDPETSNNSTTVWVNKLALTTPAAMTLGNYRLDFQFLWRSLSANKSGNIRIQIDGVDAENWEPFSANTADRPLLSGFTLFNQITGTHVITLDFKVGSAGGSTIYMSRARMSFWRSA